MTNAQWDLEGRTALVTGASRGIGRAIALGLARAGADVVGMARTAEALEHLADEVAGLGRKALPRVVDITDVDEVRAAVGEAWEWAGRVDVLVNAAGAIQRTQPFEIDPDEWDELFSVNVRSPFFVMQAVGERMIADGGGSIVNIASLAAEVVTGTSVHYAATKAALVQMTRVLAVRWAPRVRVNAVGPGYIRTSLNEAWLADDANRAYVEGRTPLGRVGTTDDVVGTVVLLASPASAFVTGQHILVDGGWSTQ